MVSEEAMEAVVVYLMVWARELTEVTGLAALTASVVFGEGCDTPGEEAMAPEELPDDDPNLVAY